MPSIIKVDQIQSDTGTVNQTSNLSFTGTGQRITWNMSPASISDRVFFQTSVTNGASDLNIMPNGTGVGANFTAFASSDPANSSLMRLGTSTSTGVAFLNSFKLGTASALPIAFQVDSTERMRITTAGVVELTSGQLKFPASQNASADPNTLDDYEEGTFTPTMTGTSPAGTAVNGDGYYTKIGNYVWVQIRFDNVSTPSGGSGALVFTGFPFAKDTTKSSRSFSGIGLVFTNNGTSIAGQDWSLRDTSDVGVATGFNVQYQSNVNQNVTNLTVANLAASGNFLRFNFGYFV
jgi:hypothetical protein